jgi:membrane-bound lytic murein transglycosylase B
MGSRQRIPSLWLLSAIIILVGLGVPVAGQLATSVTVPNLESRPTFSDWLSELRDEAIQRGIAAEIVSQAFDGIEPLERVIASDRNQAEFVLTFDRYLSRVVTPETVRRGRQLYAQHQPLLERVQEAYGVQPRFILAFWGIESRFGRVQGRLPIIPALATLAFDPRRSGFFRNQLFDALEMVNRGYIELPSMRGSWAGAMGQPQFMPSSYLAYAVDFDGDGRKDIWSTEADIFASIANYLSSHGWSDKHTWGREVRVPPGSRARIAAAAPTRASGCAAMRDMRGPLPLDRWHQLGVRRADGGSLPVASLDAWLVTSGSRNFLVYGNYRTILAYNCAHYYALTVGTLADRIGTR